ncbi:Hepatocyte growth factor-regulated tyrosine kinase substrate [Dissostichus eleginoides]|uniref:Hepatocyte growth factor-regulated tyrosine kinase substrate n=1 Tax=Dissostichus eleginoides TaxID=100907 RepID=A0AAD9B599_DISEL|nr:Hepatocyte growth factor-regulated tyrosine kinase substrate [Dissostichus eleginoides]
MGKGGGTFERLLDKATSQLLLETDWESILQICDLIRQGDAQAKYAVGAIKKKLSDKNPHVALYALEVLESVVKNCGQTVHDEVASKTTMEELKDLLKTQTEPNWKVMCSLSLRRVMRCLQQREPRTGLMRGVPPVQSPVWSHDKKAPLSSLWPDLLWQVFV